MLTSSVAALVAGDRTVEVEPARNPKPGLMGSHMGSQLANKLSIISGFGQGPLNNLLLDGFSGLKILRGSWPRPVFI